MNKKQFKQEYHRNYWHQIAKPKQPKPTYRGPSYEYVCRRLTVGNKTGDAYGITIPAKLVKEYKLLGKKFKVKVGKKGLIMLRTVINYEELK